MVLLLLPVGRPTALLKNITPLVAPVLTPLMVQYLKVLELALLIN
jgi:hypothetical protein